MWFRIQRETFPTTETSIQQIRCVTWSQWGVLEPWSLQIFDVEPRAQSLSRLGAQTKSCFWLIGALECSNGSLKPRIFRFGDLEPWSPGALQMFRPEPWSPRPFGTMMLS